VSVTAQQAQEKKAADDCQCCRARAAMRPIAALGARRSRSLIVRRAVHDNGSWPATTVMVDVMNNEMTSGVIGHSMPPPLSTLTSAEDGFHDRNDDPDHDAVAAELDQHCGQGVQHRVH
jgi:hypothetical protein